MKTHLVCLTPLILAACGTDGTSVTTGTTRPSIDKSEVVLYLTAPAKYETIGLVTAKSGKHGSDQSKMEDAVEKLKEEAADVGANGVVIHQTGESTSSSVGVVVPAGNVGLVVSHQKYRETVNGIAIYVPPESTENTFPAKPGDFEVISAAAEGGDAQSQYQLGVLYMEGTGVPQNYVEAAKWLILAKAGADTNSDTYNSASTSVDKLESRMTPSEIEQAQQAASTWFAAHSKTKE